MFTRLPRGCVAHLAAVLTVLAAGPVAADPAPLSKLNWIFDGPVQTAARLGNTLYVGGVFTSVARSTRCRR